MLSRGTLLVFFAACVGCTTQQDLGNHAPDDSGAPPQSAPAPRVDAGPLVFYATLDSSTAPVSFSPPEATSYRLGYSVLAGEAVLDAVDPYTLPTVLKMTIKFPTKVGTFACDAQGTTASIQLDEALDSNANIEDRDSTVGSASASCTITVTTADLPGGRLVGTFKASMNARTYNGRNIRDGVFDVERKPEQ
jgi:hypothetical protein